MNQTWENGQKPSFRTNFAPYGPNLGLRNFFPGFYLYMLDIVASYHCMQFQGKLKNQTWETGKKTLLLGLILAQIWATNFFFFKNLTLSVTRNHGQLSSCTISEKTNDPILRKLSDGRTDRQTDKETDRWTDGREWFHRMLSD